MKYYRKLILLSSIVIIFLSILAEKAQVKPLIGVVPIAVKKLENLKNIDFDRLKPGSYEAVFLNQDNSRLTITNTPYINTKDKIWASMIQDLYTIYVSLGGEKINQQISSVTGIDQWIINYTGSFAIGAKRPNQALVLIFKKLIEDSKTINLKTRDEILNSSDNWPALIKIIENNLTLGLQIIPSGELNIAFTHHKLSENTELIAKSNANIVIKDFEWNRDHIDLVFWAPANTPIGESYIHIYDPKSSFSPITSFNIQVIEAQKE